MKTYKSDSALQPRTMPHGITLTDDQKLALTQILQWLKSGQPGLACLPGVAGGGKSFLMAEVIKRYRTLNLDEHFDPDFESDGILVACAPTHVAKKVLIESTQNCPYDHYATIHSLLGLTPKDKWTITDQNNLDAVEERLAAAEGEEAKRLKRQVAYLKAMRLHIESGHVQFMPAPKELKALRSARLLVVDECSMVNADIFRYFQSCADLGSWCDSRLHPHLQILFVGDPEQLPPIGESISKAFSVQSFTSLQEVKRYDGNILRYATTLRNGAPLQTAHEHLIDLDNTFLSVSSDEAVIEGAAMIKSGEHLRYVAGTNAIVHRYNHRIACQVKTTKIPYYEAGDILLTRGNITREANSGEQEVACRTATELIVKSASAPAENHEQILEVSVRYSDETDKPFSGPVWVLPPQQLANHEKAVKQAWAEYRLFASKGKNTRGQAGKQAQAFWAKHGLKNWETRLDGSEFKVSEYNQLKTATRSQAWTLSSKYDCVSYSYSSTVHSCQGQTIPIVLVDFASMFGFKQHTPVNDGTWDPRKLLYTSATRASQQLLLVID
jgi:hypothetical protein